MLDARIIMDNGRPRHRLIPSPHPPGMKANFAARRKTTLTISDRTNADLASTAGEEIGIETRSRMKMSIPTSSSLVERTMVRWKLHARTATPGTLGDQHALLTEYMIRIVPGAERLAQLVCVDAAKLADHKWLYYRLANWDSTGLSTEGAAERNKAIAPDIGRSAQLPRWSDDGHRLKIETYRADDCRTRGCSN